MFQFCCSHTFVNKFAIAEAEAEAEAVLQNKKSILELKMNVMLWLQWKVVKRSSCILFLYSLWIHIQIRTYASERELSSTPQPKHVWLFADHCYCSFLLQFHFRLRVCFDLTFYTRRSYILFFILFRVSMDIRLRCRCRCVSLFQLQVQIICMIFHVIILRNHKMEKFPFRSLAYVPSPHIFIKLWL